MPTLTEYLWGIRTLYLSSKTSPTALAALEQNVRKSTVLVMGNPSADLDSFISAVTTCYFRNARRGTSDFKYTKYIPILNLPTIKSDDLWRMRPEFGVALRLALGESAEAISQEESSIQGKTPLLEQLITIADIKDDPESPFHFLFTESRDSDRRAEREDKREDEDGKQRLFLVDHNAPSIPGLSDQHISSHFTIEACIDHHVDEEVVPDSADPRIISIEAGSCTSLVVQNIVTKKLWPRISPKPPLKNNQALTEITKLALIPILIDTANLQGTGDRCTAVDREAVAFLESQLFQLSETPAPTSSTPSPWSRDQSYSAISTTKSQSLNLLTIPEIFDRDFKSYPSATAPSTGQSLTIGISSLVRHISWLVSRAGSTDTFTTSLDDFLRDMNVLCLLTRRDDGAKEILLVCRDENTGSVISEFERRSQDDLKLKDWEGEQEVKEAMDERFKGRWRAWEIGDTSKTRKNVAPLLRDCVGKL